MPTKNSAAFLYILQWLYTRHMKVPSGKSKLSQTGKSWSNGQVNNEPVTKANSNICAGPCDVWELFSYKSNYLCTRDIEGRTSLTQCALLKCCEEFQWRVTWQPCNHRPIILSNEFLVKWTSRVVDGVRTHTWQVSTNYE